MFRFILEGVQDNDEREWPCESSQSLQIHMVIWTWCLLMTRRITGVVGEFSINEIIALAH